jgi:phosphoglucomutase
MIDRINSKYLSEYERWLSNSVVDKNTKEELKNISNDPVEISSRFKKSLTFGTGGMRELLGAGINRINVYTIRKITQGVANYLREEFKNDKDLKVAIAYDSRHNSQLFAKETALVFASNGIKSFLFREIAPTPLLSFAVRELNCKAGIVITASHNPPEYNGFKFYTEDGVQAIPEITESIAKFVNKVDIFEVETISEKEALKNNHLVYIEKEFDKKYTEKILNLCKHKGKKDLKIVYSPLHGAGQRTIPNVLKECRYTNVYLVSKQVIPDPNFPTVITPNPEEKDALKLALEEAKKRDADIVLATDPDCDRIGCAVKNQKGEYVLLNGNQMGALLIYYLLSETKNIPKNPIIMKTIATGNLGAKIAIANSVQVEETHTGFKFMGAKIEEYEKDKSKNIIFAYEESYGYLAGNFVRDKDATIAAALLVDMCSHYKAIGINLLKILGKIHKEYGYHKEELITFKLKDMDIAKKILEKIANSKKIKFGESNILTKEDYTKGVTFNLIDKTKKNLKLSKADVLLFRMEDESWFCVRPSGTEPKFKIYMGVVGNNEAEAEKKLDLLKKDLQKFFND